MASAIFVVPISDNGPVLDMATIQDGTEGYGFSVIGHIPQAGTSLVRIWASDAVLDAMAADDNYLFIEDVEDAE